MTLTNAIFSDLDVGDEFSYARDVDQRGTLRWTRCRKITSPQEILGEDFADMNIVLLGGTTGLVDHIDGKTPARRYPKQ